MSVCLYSNYAAWKSNKFVYTEQQITVPNLAIYYKCNQELSNALHWLEAKGWKRGHFPAAELPGQI